MKGFADARDAWIAAGGVGALVLVTLGLALRLGAPVREASVLIAANADGGVATLRVSTANTGLVDPVATVRLAFLPADAPPLAHRATRLPTRVDEDGVAAPPDSLRREGNTWSATIGGEGLQARLTLRAAGDDPRGCPVALGPIAGTIEDGRAGQTFDGSALIVRTRARFGARATALYAVGPTLALGLDPHGTCPAFVRGSGVAWTGPAPGAPPERPGESAVLGPVRITVEARTDAVALEPLDHVTAPERWLGRLAGLRPTFVRRARVRVRGPTLPEDGVALPAVLYARGDAR
ncbi:MAG: hypothetical protein RLZZ299_936 [Pseudomonadota bacterium]